MESKNPESSTGASSTEQIAMDRTSEDGYVWGPQDFLGHVKRHKRDAANRFEFVLLIGCIHVSRRGLG